VLRRVSGQSKLVATAFVVSNEVSSDQATIDCLDSDNSLTRRPVCQAMSLNCPSQLNLRASRLKTRVSREVCEEMGGLQDDGWGVVADVPRPRSSEC
jgi:hypothetical protein